MKTIKTSKLFSNKENALLLCEIIKGYNKRELIDDVEMKEEPKPMQDSFWRVTITTQDLQFVGMIWFELSFFFHDGL